MTEQNHNPPGGEDVVLDQQLHTLKRFTPYIGFENRVLSKVWRPAPMFLLIWKDRLSRWASPGRRWAALAAASLGSLITTMTVANVVFTTDTIEAGRAWVADVASRISSEQVLNVVLPWLSTLAGYVTRVPAAAVERWAGVAIGVALVPAVSLVGLYLVMRRPMSERVRSYASR